MQSKNLFNLNLRVSFNRFLSYKQGQEPEPKIREYFYYVDHQGMLFLDDARMKNFTSCFKDKKFLKFFFDRLKINTTNRYKENFPYISLCGRERNFLRCDDYPIVFTHILPEFKLSHNHAGDLLTFPFEPNKIYMPESGRIYHPAHERVGGIGLIRSKLAIEISRNFRFGNGDSKPPTCFLYEDVEYELDDGWFYKARG